MTEYTVEDALAEIGDLIRCRCHPAYKDRKMHDPECHCDSAEAVSTVAAEVARLTAERDALRAQIASLPRYEPEGEPNHHNGAAWMAKDDGGDWIKRDLEVICPEPAADRAAGAGQQIVPQPPGAVR